jgi:hypothetical protein
MGEHWSICCSVSVTRQHFMTSPAAARRCAVRIFYDAQTFRLWQSCACGDVLQTKSWESTCGASRVLPNKLLHDEGYKYPLLFKQLLLSVMKYVYVLHRSIFIWLYVTMLNTYLYQLLNVKILRFLPVLCIYVSYDAETSQTQSHITTGGLSASLSWCQTRSRSKDQIFVTVRQLRFCLWGALSDQKTGLSFPAVRISSTWLCVCKIYTMSLSF